MVPHEQPPFETAAMLESNSHRSPSSPLRHSSKPYTSFFTDTLFFLAGSTVALLLIWTLWSFIHPPSSTMHSDTLSLLRQTKPQIQDRTVANKPFMPTFYDFPDLSYSIEKPVKNWDLKRRQWLSYHPSLAAGVQERILMVTGSQPGPCKNPIGDHLLLRFFKNKVDYCRIHGLEIFYNNALFHPKMGSFWAKLPLVRAAMVAHPESEWIWWVDSDAAFTDMEFKPPLDRYKDHNLIVHGWSNMIYDNRSWVGLNAGIFLIRNCQWSMDFMDVWASMGPQTPNYDKWGQIQRSTLSDKLFPEADDQSALVYLLLEEKDKYAGKIYLESEFYFEGYWKDIVGTLDRISAKYARMEKENARTLRRPHAEKTTETYSTLREPYLKGAGYGKGSWRRPFITHFTGCQPCSGNHNEIYSAESCWSGMQKVLNFADNQILRNYGLMRRDILDSSSITQFPLD